jgi:protein-tyrosine-phosphatase
VKFAFVCNQNQARSQVLSAVFSKLLPDHVFRSFGIIAQENARLPLVIESVFTDWGLDSNERKARNIGLHRNEIMGMDVVIAATKFIAEEVYDMGFTGQILDLELQALALGVDLVDPQLMPQRRCAYELAKYVKVAYSAVQGLGYGRNLQPIKALIPEQESSIGAALDFAANTMTENSVIIYGDLIAPRNALITSRLGQGTKFHSQGSVFKIGPVVDGYSRKVFLPAHAVMWPTKMYVSEAWAGLFDQIGAESAILITPPQRNQSGVVAESYLAAVYASEIQTIS